MEVKKEVPQRDPLREVPVNLLHSKVEREEAEEPLRKVPRK
jgi:hypothetical protein